MATEATKAFAKQETDLILQNLKTSFRRCATSRGVRKTAVEELAAAVMRGFFLTVSHRDNIGPLYPHVLDTLVRGACQRLFPEN